MPPVGFEPKISAGERQQTHALERAATGTANTLIYFNEINEWSVIQDSVTYTMLFSWILCTV